MTSRPTTAADRVYRTLLRLLPARTRAEIGPDLVQMFRDRRQELRGRPARLVALWVAAAGDVAAAAWRERRDARRQRGGRLDLNSLVQDVRYAVRLLARDPGFTAVAVLVLAIGIGANAAAFSLVNALLLKPLPGHPAGDVVGVYDKDESHPGSFVAFSYPEFVELRAHHEIFAALTAHNFAFAAIADGDHARQAIVDMVSSDFFDVFGAPPILGRAFTVDEERPGSGADVAILSYGAWQRRGGTPAVLGTTVRVNGWLLTIVGVAAEAFGGSLAMITPDLWVPLSAYDRLANDFMRGGTTTTLADRRTRMLVVDAQLLPGRHIASAAPALAAMTAQLAAADPTKTVTPQLILAPLARSGVSTSPQTDAALTGVTVALLSLSGIVLLIASLNLANMLLARGAARQQEFAIRVAIGGGRARLVRQLLTEGVVLAVVGGAIGLVLASWGTSALAASLARGLPFSMAMDSVPDGRVLAATLAFCAVSVVLFSLGPALRLSRPDVAAALKNRAGEIAGRSRFRGRHLLVTGQLALSLVMLTAAALFVRSALQAASANPGFSLDRGIIIQVDASLAGRSVPQMQATYARALERLRARPEVVSASLASNMPFSGMWDERPVQRVGARLPDNDPHRVSAEYTSIGADYFRTLGRSMLQGREFSIAEEMSATRHLAVVDEPLARILFGTGNAVGQPVQYDTQVAGQPPVVLQIVGVAPGFINDLFDAGPVPHLYVPYGQEPRGSVYLHVRTSATTAAAEASLLPALRTEVLAVDPQLPILASETRAMFRDRGIILAIVRAGARVFTVFGLAALLLAVVGVYGVKAYVVSRRTREIGIRFALGATRSSVIWLVVREGLGVAVVGLGAGAVLAALAGAGLRSMTYQGRGADMSVLVATGAVLLVASMAAAVVPARRAMRIEPVTALKT